ncbi:MAG: hypothetical protein ACYSUI_23255 [Planctomycetota bacterium]
MLSEFLAHFRRQMRAANLLRLVLGAGLLAGLVVFYRADHATRRWILVALAAVAGLWIALALRGLQAVKRTRIGAALLAAGRVEEGCQVLGEALSRFTPLRSAKILACHQLAVAAHLAHCYREAVAICRELLAYRLGAMRNLAAPTRLILADSLLLLDDVQAADPVIEALESVELSLADQLTFLPVELRFQLAVGRHAQVVNSLPEKVGLADLLDSTSACLVHTLLAEGCRRMHLASQQAYLLRRAALLADVEPIVARHGRVLSGLAGQNKPLAPSQTMDG